MQGRTAVLVTALVMCFACGGPIAPQRKRIAHADAIRTHIASIVDPIVAAAPYHGVGIVLVERGRETVITFGRRGENDPRPPDADTTFEIGSVSKVFAGVLLADAAQRGEVDLAGAARAYLPTDLALPVRGRDITLGDLAAHLSGLPFMPANFVGLDPETRRTRYQLDDARFSERTRCRPSPASATSTATSAPPSSRSRWRSART